MIGTVDISTVLVTFILLWLSCIEESVVEFIFIIGCFGVILYLLMYKRNKIEGFVVVQQETPASIFDVGIEAEEENGYLYMGPKLQNLDLNAFKQLTTLPSVVDGLIRPPIQQLANYATGKSSPNASSMISVQPNLYKNDLYVGTVQEELQKDVFGRVSTVTKYIPDPTRFLQMLTEYSNINNMLTDVQNTDPQLFNAIISS